MRALLFVCLSLVVLVSHGLPFPSTSSLVTAVSCTAPDTTPPVLNSFRIQLVGSQMTYSVNATDGSGSGWAAVYISEYRSTGGGQVYNTRSFQQLQCCSDQEIDLGYSAKCPCIANTPPSVIGNNQLKQIHATLHFPDDTYTVVVRVVDAVGNIATYPANSLQQLGFDYVFTVNLMPAATKTLALAVFDVAPQTYDGNGSPLNVAYFNLTATGTGATPDWEIQISYYPDKGYGFIPGHVNPPIVASNSFTNGELGGQVGLSSIVNIHDGLWHPFVLLIWGSLKEDSAVYTVSSPVISSGGDLTIIHTSNDTVPPVCTNFVAQASASSTSGTAQIQVTALCDDSSGVLVGSSVLYFFRDQTSGYEFVTTASDLSVSTTFSLPQYYPATNIELIGAAFSDLYHNVVLYGRCSRGYQLQVQAITTLNVVCGAGSSSASTVFVNIVQLTAIFLFVCAHLL